MSAPLSLTEELNRNTQAYSNGLEHYHQATRKLSLAKRQLETAKAHYLCEGVEGKNQAERDAKLDLLLLEETVAAEFLEDEQALAELRLEQARLAWDLARYKIRALEAMREVA